MATGGGGGGGGFGATAGVTVTIVIAGGGASSSCGADFAIGTSTFGCAETGALSFAGTSTATFGGPLRVFPAGFAISSVVGSILETSFRN